MAISLMAALLIVVASNNEQANTIATTQTDAIEVIKPIHDYDLEFQQQAQTAAEEQMSYHSKESHVRWAAIRINPLEIISGDFLTPGSMPERLTLTPFPDAKYEAVMVDYQIMENLGAAIWVGQLQGHIDGQVEITIVRGFDGLGFEIRIFNSQRPMRITGTDIDNAYIAIQGKPYPPQRMN